MLHTMFEVQCIHLQAALWMGMTYCHRSKSPPFESGLPPPLGITEVQVYFFPLLHSLCQRLDSKQLTPKTCAVGARKIKREEAQEIPRSGETNLQFLALNSCKAHTSSISCSYLVCDTDYLLLCVGKFFFSPDQDKFFFFLPMWVKFFFFLLCVGQVFFFLPLSGSSFFFYKNFLLPPSLKSNGASLRNIFLSV